MSYTNETTHYGIPLPLGSDLTTPMDYNTAMEAIDADLFSAKGAAEIANTNASNALDGVANINNNVIGGANGIDARLTAVEGTQTTQGTAITNLANTVGDNKQDLMDAICSIVEASATATAQHLVGTYFWYNDTLYKTTVQINVNDTIVPNTNCQTTNVTTEILGVDVDLSSYQTKTDNNLQTTDKTVVGAVNELKSSLIGVTVTTDSVSLNADADTTINVANCLFAFGVIASATSSGADVGIYSNSDGNGGWNIRIKNHGSTQTVGYQIVKFTAGA